MGIFDEVLSQVSGHTDVANLAAKIGIDPAMAEKAIAALGMAHQEPGDTVTLAAEKTGLGAGTLTQIVEQIGGEGSLTEFAGMIAKNPAVLSLLDRDGDGNPINDVIGMASGLFGKK
ncbi:hypothetical protein [Novosphingobium album (ex Liu et al. 2023)]|uniref:DUF937 domain-containing protein n=1 Tax=Novosphingobium album (ex Liu et al. 2023) TaxID=3031130 RepID=A0ABT5WPI1_9SPHN|nr:hypothetical protein [Novosphingobium album (ex Liu et al. 2023)]MDE8651953.1 hypothetical protein [Novosphingobium album (ex Liu et al. 2023)]